MKTIATKVNDDVYEKFVDECNKDGITVSAKLRELVRNLDTTQSGKRLTHAEYSLDDLTDLMKLQIEETSMTGKEMGFSVCGNENVEIAEKGTSNSIALKKCPGLTLLFHTHPCGTPFPSEQDFVSVQDIHTLKKTCIGTADGIRCFHPHTGEKTDEIHIE